MTDHIVRSFDEQLRRLTQLVEDMGKLTSEQLKAALEAIISQGAWKNRRHEPVKVQYDG